MSIIYNAASVVVWVAGVVVRTLLRGPSTSPLGG
jgi:hypothetical protein